MNWGRTGIELDNNNWHLTFYYPTLIVHRWICLDGLRPEDKTERQDLQHQRRLLRSLVRWRERICAKEEIPRGKNCIFFVANMATTKQRWSEDFWLNCFPKVMLQGHFHIAWLLKLIFMNSRVHIHDNGEAIVTITSQSVTKQKSWCHKIVGFKGFFWWQTMWNLYWIENISHC